MVNSLLDSFFVQSLGVESLTAIGAAISLIFLLFSIAMSLGTAATALVSRSFGAGDLAECVTANKKCMGTAVAVGLALTAISLPGSSLLSLAMLSDNETHSRALMVTYLWIYALGLPAIFVIQVLAGSLRGIGDTKSPMVVSGIQILLHMGLNFFLINPGHTIGPVRIMGLGWGLTGAAIAMSASAWAAAAIYVIWTKKTPLSHGVSFAWPGSAWLSRIFRIAFPASLLSVVRVTSLMAFTSILSKVPGGGAAVGALRPSFSIESLAFMPGFGLSMATSALVGQSLGMGRPDRAEKLAWLASHHAAIVGTLASVLLFVFSHQVASALVPTQPTVAAHVSEYLRFACTTEMLFAYAMVLIGALQGAGDTLSTFWMTIVCMWMVRVPLAWLLAHPLNLGAAGCWMSMAVSQGVQGLAAMWLFKQGAWKHKKV